MINVRKIERKCVTKAIGGSDVLQPIKPYAIDEENVCGCYGTNASEPKE